MCNVFLGSSLMYCIKVSFVSPRTKLRFNTIPWGNPYFILSSNHLYIVGDLFQSAFFTYQLDTYPCTANFKQLAFLLLLSSSLQQSRLPKQQVSVLDFHRTGTEMFK